MAPRLSQALIEQIAQRVRRGIDLARAAELAGVEAAAARGWLERGERGDVSARTRVAAFVRAVRQARAQHAESLVRQLHGVIAGTRTMTATQIGRAHAWLEHNYPEFYGPSHAPKPTARGMRSRSP